MRKRVRNRPEPIPQAPPAPAWLVTLINIVIVIGLLWFLSQWMPLVAGLVITLVVVALVVRDGLH